MTTITIERALLEQALEALNKVQWPSRQTTDAIEAIRARLAHTEGKSATAPAQPERKPMTDEQIEKAREATFSTGNPYCPVDSKSMRKAARAVEAFHGIKGVGQAMTTREAFETEARKHGFILDRLDKSGVYVQLITEQAWSIWQAATDAAPTWHDAPTVPGTWILSLDSGMEVQENITQHEIDIEATWPGGRWFGPLPEDKP